MSFVPAFRHTKAAGLGIAAVAAMTLVWSCGSDTTEPPPPPPVPANVTPVTGTNGQTADAGSPVANAPSVTVTTAGGAGVSGVSVAFAVTGGGGSVTGATATTDAQGVATVGGWTLGTTAGSNTMTATVNSIVATFTATGVAGPAASIALEAGDGQTATTGTAVPVAPAVKVEDTHGNVVSGATVTFAPMDNSQVAGSPATTDAGGIATVTSWTMGDLGNNTLEASVSGVGAPVVFTAFSTGIPATITMTAGDNQTTSAGFPVPTDPAVEVRDAGGTLLEMITVTFAITQGGGSVSIGMATTDASGIASIGWTLGTVAGPNVMEATVAGVASPVTFNATGVAGPPTQVQITSGDAQSSKVATALANPVQATLQDQFGNGVELVTLQFSPLGDGSVDNTNVTTDVNGNASVIWTLGTAAGTQTLDVTSSITGVTPGQASATAFPDDATTLTITAGDNQSAVQGTAVAVPPAVLAQDQFGNPAPSTSITFAPSGDGSVGASPVGTDAQGVATTSWTLTSTPGGNTLVATAPNVAATPSVTFNATATVQVGSITINAGDGQSATVNTAVANPIIVLVRDVSGNPAPNIPVTFTVTLGGGSVTGANQVTDAAGITSVTSWTMGTTVGANELSASVDSDPSNLFVLFGATATAGPATTMTVSAGDNQNAAVGTPVPIAPAVLIEDAFNNPIQGVSVTFTPSGDGSVTGSPATTDASGIATVGNWTLATTAGANTLDASASGLTNVTFNATGTVTVLNIAILQGDDQTGSLTGPLPTNPTVRVTDQGTGAPVAGVSVSFTPRSGEGSVNNPTVITDANGDAAVQWTPGRNGSNFMDVDAGGATTQFFSIGSNSAFKIELVFVTGTETMAQKQAFGDAAGRWMNIITGDLAPFTGTVSAGSCTTNQPSFTGTVDDLKIWVELGPIDGPGNVVGSAGPCAFVRNSPFFSSILGGMTFDTDDLGGITADGRLGDVILHEMGHVIGIGVYWSPSFTGGLVNPSVPACTGNPGCVDTHYTGANSITSFDNVGGTAYTIGSKVPVENNGQPGTGDGHWRESTFVTELMTGFVSAAGTPNPLSEVTIANLQDYGYTIDASQADAYTLGNPNALRVAGPGSLRLVNDIMWKPLDIVDQSGRVIGTVRP